MTLEAERRRLWRESGLNCGIQNKAWVLNFGVTYELVKDKILMPHPEALGVEPAIWELTNLADVSEIHESLRSNRLDI